MLADDDVRFYWCLLSVEIGDAEREVLKMIVNLFITFRGFSFTKSVMETREQKINVHSKVKIFEKKINCSYFCGKFHYCEHFVFFHKHVNKPHQ